MSDETADNNETLLKPGDRFGPFQVTRLISKCLTGELYSSSHTATGEYRCFYLLPDVIEKMPNVSRNLQALLDKHKALGEVAEILSFTEIETIEGRTVLYVQSGEYKSVASILRSQFESAVEGLTPTVDESLPEDVRLQSASPFPQIVPVRLDAELAKKYLEQTATGIKLAHAGGLHHYNLVAENLIIDENDQVKVLGFGLIESLDEETFQTLASESIPPLREGEPVHLTLQVNDLFPMEVQRGESFDSNSDVFGFGVLAYYVFTGTRPQAPYTAVSSIVKEVPIGWDVLIQRCLQGEKNKRYPTAGALLKDVQRADTIKAPTFGQSAEKDTGRPVKGIPLKLILLSVVVLVVLLGGAYFLLFSGSDRTLTNNTGGPRVTVLDDGQSPALQITVKPSHARVRFSGAAQGNISSADGRLAVGMPEGQYRLQVSAPYYKTEARAVEYTGEPVNLEFDLEPAWAAVEIVAEPLASLAVKTETGKLLNLGRADNDGILELENKLFAGEYTIVATKPGFEEASQPVSLVSDEVNRVRFDMAAQAMSVLINSIPEGAEVFYNGISLGTAPLTSTDLPLMVPVSLEARLDRFIPGREVITFEPGKSNAITIGPLEPITGSIDLEVSLMGKKATSSELAELTYSLDGEVITEDVFNGGIQIGQRQLTVTHPEYYPSTVVIDVSEDQITDATVNLLPQPGSLTLDINPNDIQYFLRIDGKLAEEMEEVYEVPSNKEVDIELIPRDHLPETTRLSLSPGEEYTWSLDLKPIPPPEPGKPYTVPILEQEFQPVEGGIVVMGSPPQEQSRRPNESPRTEVTLTHPYWLSAYEVTQEEYEKVMRGNPSVYKGQDRPVENVTFAEASEYCRRLTLLEERAGRLPEGYVYRLPTEAEWEHACNPNTNEPFHFGEEADSSMGNFSGVYPLEFGSAEIEGDDYGTEPVGSYAPNSLGLYDMHGNVAEWTYGSYNDRYTGLPRTNYAGAAAGDDRAVRGGGWSDPAHRCRVAARERQNITTRAPHVGFRVALAIDLSDRL